MKLLLIISLIFYTSFSWTALVPSFHNYNKRHWNNSHKLICNTVNKVTFCVKNYPHDKFLIRGIKGCDKYCEGSFSDEYLRTKVGDIGYYTDNNGESQNLNFVLNIAVNSMIIGMAFMVIQFILCSINMFCGKQTSYKDMNGIEKVHRKMMNDKIDRWILQELTWPEGPGADLNSLDLK